MPPKDDDDPASTKEVVTKKQKQLLNREELNLAAIAEAFGGFLIEKKRRNRGSSRGGGEGFENQGTENKPKKGGARSGGRSKGNKPVTVNPGSIDPDESAIRAAEADYESDLRKGKTDPISGSPRPDDRGSDRKSYRDLMRDLRKSALGRRKGTATSSRGNVSNPASVRADRTSKYRAQGGGRRGAYLRRTGRLSPATAPQTQPSKPKLPQWMQDFQRGAAAGRARVTSKIPAAAYLVPALSKLATAATIGATVGQGVGETRRSEIDRQLKKLPTTKTKPGTTISYAPDNNPRMYPDAIKQLTKKQLAALTPQQKYMTQTQYDRSIAGTDLEIKTATSTKAEPKTQTQGQTAAPPKSPTVVGVPPIPGGPGGPGRTTRGPGGGKTKNNKFKFGAPQQPRGKIGRRQNPQ